MSKPTLIISCSAAKADSSMSAFDLYQGGIFTLIRANVDDIHDHFNVLIFSALYGLIDSKELIQPYNVVMPSHPASLDDFVATHKVMSTKNLDKYAGKDAGVFVVLPNKYLAAFDGLLAQSCFNKVFHTYQSHYISRKHSGIGVLRQRLKFILNYAQKGTEVVSPTLFRSGLSNDDEIIGMRHTTEDVGASLAYVSDIKRPDLLSYFVMALRQGRKVFLDNGMISSMGSGTPICADEVFARYQSIVNGLKPGLAKRLYVVIPDDPFDQQNSLAIVHNHKNVIKFLAKRCHVILPVHKGVNPQAHAKQMLKQLDNIENVVLGIPTRVGIGKVGAKVSLRMSLADIEGLLSAKNCRGKRLFSSVHFLGMSEKAKGKAFINRKVLAQLYRLPVSFDACRTTALIGNYETSKRAGTVVLRKIKKKKTKLAVLRSTGFTELREKLLPLGGGWIARNDCVIPNSCIK